VTEPALALTAPEITEFLREVFPGSMDNFVIEEVVPNCARVRMPFAPFRLRPGGTISGPSLMALADSAMWIALLGMIGRVPLSVTSHLDIDFLRKAEARDVVGEAKLLKLGRRLAVGEVHMWSDGEPHRLCARASVTYAIPAGS
jgi:uncharacterized protein (TIGR00369 family)